jgi:hypothetical protein
VFKRRLMISLFSFCLLLTQVGVAQGHVPNVSMTWARTVSHGVNILTTTVTGASTLTRAWQVEVSSGSHLLQVTLEVSDVNYVGQIKQFTAGQLQNEQDFVIGTGQAADFCVNDTALGIMVCTNNIQPQGRTLTVVFKYLSRTFHPLVVTGIRVARAPFIFGPWIKTPAIRV